jgi:hypothetical protein
MHLIINLGDLLINLYQKNLDCYAPDTKDAWDFAVLVGENWDKHGVDVAACTSYLPGSMDRPPWNPALKFHSGYKCWELLLYMFGLGPGLFYGLFPPSVFCHYCHLVAGVRLIYQHRITFDQLSTAQGHLTRFIADFEELYYCRLPERLHSC